jgi:hypothetical protein
MLIALALALSTSALAQEEAPPIVGGSTTSDFAAVGAIVASYGSSGADFCSGTLVDSNWVVTAAHCVDAAIDYERYGYDIYFVLGSSVSSIDDYAQAVELYMHPSYGGSSVANDIGLLELGGGGITSVTPVVMNTTAPSDSWSEITYVGFGITGDGRSDSGTKRTVSVDYYGRDSQFVYTLDPDGRTNICSGDSGGAALWWDGSQYVLAGANSFGFDIYGGRPTCEGDGAAAGATRVDAYRSWIDTTMATGEGGSTGGSSSGGGSGSGGSSSGGSSSGGGSGSDGGSGSGDDGGSGSGSGDDGGDGGVEDETESPAETFGDTTAPEPGGCSVTGLGMVGLGALALPAFAAIRRRED